MANHDTIHEKTKNNPMSLSAKKSLVKIGKQLGYLKEEDIEFIINPDTSEIECQQRLIACRHR